MSGFSPDYQDRNLVNLMQSLIVGRGGNPRAYPALASLPVDEVANARNVVLLVIDGLGYASLAERARGGCLHSHLRDRLTSVFPSTTAAAISTFLTGEAPQQHAMTGWYMYVRELGSVMAVLPGRLRGAGVAPNNGESLARKLYGHTPVFDRMPAQSHVVTPQWIAHSDYNRTHLGRARMRPFETLEEMFDACADIAGSSRGKTYVYAYWPQFDALSHEHGVGSAEIGAHLRDIDDAFGRFLERIRGTDTLVVVTADHGFIDTMPSDRIVLDDHPELADCLRLPLCGESRVAYCYVRPDRVSAFERYVSGVLAGKADLYPSGELIARGWFGTGPAHPQLAARVGDYALVMRDHFVIKDWLPLEKRFEQIGVHGGISADEMYVPLLVAHA